MTFKALYQRPRKCLSYKTPAEALIENLTVALENVNPAGILHGSDDQGIFLTVQLSSRTANDLSWKASSNSVVKSEPNATTNLLFPGNTEIKFSLIKTF